MNIHIKNKNTFSLLKDSSILKIPIGSKMYKLDIDSSDDDYLYIYSETEYDSKSINYEHHQLQYKENNIDHNFTTPRNFIRNILTGDSTINLECLFTQEMKESSLNDLYSLRFDFITFNVLNSYLGLVKRDLKYAGKVIQRMYFEQDFFMLTSKTSEILLKKMYHIIRGLSSYKGLLERTFTLDYDFKCEISDDLKFESVRDILIKIRNESFDNYEIVNIFGYALEQIDKYKDELSNLSIHSKISKFPDIEVLKVVDENIRSIPYYKDVHSVIKDEYISSINGVLYD